MVLKDGQIVEQGTHTELLALGGVFASMWADQISTSGGLQTSVGADSPLPEAEISGYSVEPEQPEEDVEVIAEGIDLSATDNALAEDTLDEVTVESPEPDVVAVTQVPDEPEPKGADEETSPPAQVAPESAAPIAFPASEPAFVFPSSPTSPLAAEPLTFPVAEETETPQETPSVQTPGVTFEPSLASPTASPDPDNEPKRKRISSQNFQRLARRISLTTRRQGSTSSMASIIPGLKRDKTSTDDNSVRGEGSVRNSIDSPTASVSSDKDKGKSKKKDKKDKKKSRT